MHLISTTYPNGQKTTYLYSPDQWISEIQNLKSASPSVNLSKFDYTYIAQGDILTWTRQNDGGSATVYNYTYDPADQLLSASLGTGSTVATRSAYGYDFAGNRTSEQTDLSVTSASYNNLNQLTGKASGGPLRIAGTLSEPATVTIGGTSATVTGTNFWANVPTTPGINTVTAVATNLNGLAKTNGLQFVTSSGLNQSLSYDANGNLVNDGTKTYEWDAANRLIAIDNDSLRSEFAYDGLGRRVRIVEKNYGSVTGTKQLVWDGNTIAEERNASNAVTKRFYPQGKQVGSSNYYYTRDHLGSVREVTDGSAALQARYDYDPYGRTTLVSGTNLSDFQYAGYYEHQPSGLCLTDNRAYDPNTARWLSRDPDGEIETDAEDDDGGDDGTVGGMNLYGYVGNNSLSYYDDDGLGHKKTKQSTGKFKGSKKERHQKGQSRPKGGARPGNIKPNMDQNQSTFCPIPSPGPLPLPTQPSPVPQMPSSSPDDNPSPVYAPIYIPPPTPTQTAVGLGVGATAGIVIVIILLSPVGA